MKRFLLPAALSGLVAVLFLAASTVALAAQPHAMHMEHKKSGTALQGVTSLDVYADGQTIHVLAGLRLPGQTAELQYTRSDDSGEHWSGPVRVDKGMPTPYDRLGMDPQIAAAGQQIVAVWTTHANNTYGRGPMATALSADGGLTWHEGPNPADDHSSSDHGMIDITADASGTFHLVWLDDRCGQKGLQYARSSDGGSTWSRNQTLDPATCQCCWNTIVTNPNGRIAVLYRSLSPRDMAVIVSPDRGDHWEKPVVVGSFGWKINACPHAGGGLGFSKGVDCDHCHAVVWTGKSPSGVYALSSTDDGKQWRPPHRLGDGTAMHPTLATGPKGQVAAAWEGQSDGHPAIFTARSTNDGNSWSQPIRLSDAASWATYPRMIWTEKGFRAFWVEHSGNQPTVWKSRLIRH